jgi:hypothetical protein
MPAPPAIDISRWTALDWSEGTLEIAERRNRVVVRDLIPWGAGFLAVGFVEDSRFDPPARGLIWRTDDGLDWRLVSDESATFAGADLCCVTRARDALIASTRDSGIFVSSVDGLTWTRTEHTGGGSEFMVTETSDGLFGLATPFDGRAWTTTDGVSWTAIRTIGLDLKAFGAGPPGLLATDFGYLLAAEAVGSGLFDGHVRWANWFSPDGVTWQDFAFIEGATMAVGGRNAHEFSLMHGYVYATERPWSGAFFWPEPPKWRTSDGLRWELVEPRFPAFGSFDGLFTMEFGGEGLVRLSPDGESVVELEPALLERPYGGSPAAVGKSGVVVFQNDSGPRPVVWFGRAVVDVPSAVRPAVYCGSVNAAICVWLTREVASRQPPSGSAFVVSGRSCGLTEWFCSDAQFDEGQFDVVVVPPSWPGSGRPRGWLYEDGELFPVPRSADALSSSSHRLLDAGPWTDAVVGDQLWVAFRRIDDVALREVMRDHRLTALTAKPAEDVLWYGVAIQGRWSARAKLAELRADPRVCAADYIRFDPAVLIGEGEPEPLRPPNDSCG